MFLLGDNGCGKTTLLKVLMKDYAPDDGTFKFGSNVLTGYFDQVQAKLDLTKTAIEEVWSSFPSMSETSVRSALAAFCSKVMRFTKIFPIVRVVKEHELRF